MYRQGDVLLVPVPERSDAMVRKVHGRVILAHGEATGHHHSFATDSGVALLDAGDETFLRVPREAALEHQEHATVQVAPGYYRVVRQREYDDSAEWRQVAD